MGEWMYCLAQTIRAPTPAGLGLRAAFPRKGVPRLNASPKADGRAKTVPTPNHQELQPPSTANDTQLVHGSRCRV